MKKKNIFAILFTLLVGFYFFSDDTSAQAMTEEEQFLSEVKVYENGELIPYTLEELRGMISYTPKPMLKYTNENVGRIVSANSISKYVYTSSAFSFKSYIYLAGGTSFRNPVDLEVVPKGTSKAFTIEIRNTDLNTLSRDIDFPKGYVGSVFLHISGLARNYSYSVKFINYYNENAVEMTKAVMYYNG